jgi:putative transcriptional regulator
MIIDSLEPPLFLIAMPQIADPFFNHGVVLLLEHHAEGSFGIIVNRPLEAKLSEVMGEIGDLWGGNDDAVVYLGGPVEPTAGITLFGPHQAELDPERVTSIAPELNLANDSETLRLLANHPPPHFRLFIGFAGWGGGQLEEELGRNDWLLAPLDLELLFAEEPETVWARALASIGVRPEALPSWTAGAGGSEN